MVRQSAEVENNMNSVERIVHYANEVEQEAAYENPEQNHKLLGRQKVAWNLRMYS